MIEVHDSSPFIYTQIYLSYRTLLEFTKVQFIAYDTYMSIYSTTNDDGAIITVRVSPVCIIMVFNRS